MNPQQLRASGPASIANLLALRPDALTPAPPRSLTELAARLEHPVSLSLALSCLPLPAVQVAEALAALGAGADRAGLEQLLGLRRSDTPPAATTLLTRELDRLSAYRLLVPGTYQLEADVAGVWPAPLNLYLSLDSYLPTLTVPELIRVVDTWALRRPEALRKNTLIALLKAVLTDGTRARQVLASAPDGLGEELVAAAHGRRYVAPFGYSFYARASGSSRAHPLAWALDRRLLVRTPEGWLVMPREVALALRGPGWHAPFTPEPPAGEWVPVPAQEVRDASGTSAAQAVRLVADVLRAIEARPLTLLKNGDVGAREIRRVAKTLSVAPEQVRWILPLAHQAGLLELTSHLEVTDPGRYWLDLAPTPALAVLAQSWWTLPDLPSYIDDLAWGPGYQPGVERLRHVVLQVLAEHRGTTAADPRTLLDAVVWAAPLLLGALLTEQDDDTPSPDTDDPDRDEEEADPAGPVLSILAEAAFLGLAAAGTLSEAGHALLEGRGPDAVAAALETTLGPAQEDVVLQADLTATVLGQPSGRLTTVLNRMAERESQSAATIWRFTPAAVRRALDAGHTGEDLLGDLGTVSRGEIPQALTYLVKDIARQHGRLRAGSAGCYLRCEDAPLLAEAAADRRLRKHGLRLLAPTVLISTSALPDLLAALRSSGYGAVEETPEGATVPVHRPGHRPLNSETAPGLDQPTSSTGPLTTAEPVDVSALIERLLSEPDRPRNLINVGQTIIDIDSLDDYIAAHPD